jgi:hypothetical protein
MNTARHRNTELDDATVGRVDGLLAHYKPINLSEMTQVTLFDRVETKYVLGLSQLYTALQSLADHYRVLEIEETRLNRYQTIYFDTLDFWLYQQHHNGYGSRYKVRTRRYVDTDINFFEVKYKNNQKRTIKTRFQTSELKTELDAEADAFVWAHTPLRTDGLQPKLWNYYLRATLVSLHRPERLTLDMKLTFSRDNRVARLPGVAIAEVKQADHDPNSEFVQRMRELGIRSTPFSKYCMGASLLYSGLKSNNFKLNQLRLQKIVQEESERDAIH